jgi:hypothetical protein
MFLDTQEQDRVTLRLTELCERARRSGDGGRPEEGFSLIQAACMEELEIEYRVLAMLDAVSAAQLLSETWRVLGWAQLLEAMGEIEDDALKARQHFEHALQIVSAHREKVGPGKPRIEAALDRLLGHFS